MKEKETLRSNVDTEQRLATSVRDWGHSDVEGRKPPGNSVFSDQCGCASGRRGDGVCPVVPTHMFGLMLWKKTLTSAFIPHASIWAVAGETAPCCQQSHAQLFPRLSLAQLMVRILASMLCNFWTSVVEGKETGQWLESGKIAVAEALRLWVWPSMSGLWTQGLTGAMSIASPGDSLLRRTLSWQWRTESGI